MLYNNGVSSNNISHPKENENNSFRFVTIPDRLTWHYYRVVLHPIVDGLGICLRLAFQRYVLCKGSAD